MKDSTKGMQIYKHIYDNPKDKDGNDKPNNMNTIKEIIKNNWGGEGIFPEWWDLPFYHKIWLAPFLFIQALIAIPAFIISEYRKEKNNYLNK
jgi:hypothetical protein